MALVPPNFGEATVEKITVNAVMPTPEDPEGFNVARLPKWLDPANAATLVPKVASPDAIILVVVGGTAGRCSLCAVA